jgi:hypothetical protein
MCQHHPVVRVSFAVRPPDEVTAMVAALPRPPRDGVSWTVPERWIVKLRPLGHVPVELYNTLIDAVADELDGAPPVRVALGPTTERRYGGQQLSAPVTGLDELSDVIFAATEPIVPVTHPQPFHADLVLAGGRIPADLAGAALRIEWVVTGVSLVADRSSPQAVKLADVATITLNG